MSSESFKQFMAKVQNDQGLKQELRAAGGASGMSAEAVVAFAATKGYAFKVEDVSSELTDQQLDAVAGGLQPPDGITANQPPDALKLNNYLSVTGKVIFKF
jgi:predicted ribosomally synthesized peptide with nif11-like leader